MLFMKRKFITVMVNNTTNDITERLLKVVLNTIILNRIPIKAASKSVYQYNFQQIYYSYKDHTITRSNNSQRSVDAYFPSSCINYINKTQSSDNKNPHKNILHKSEFYVLTAH
jgi:hypothetical protein